MRKLSAMAVALAASLSFGPGAFASPIADGSEFNVTGVSMFNATTITFANPESAPGGNTGDFAAFGSCVGCVTMTTPLTYDPFTPGMVYTATNGPLTTTFTITSNVSVTRVGTRILDVVDRGIATLTGFDPTPGTWTFTANEGRTTGSFSATTAASAIPEPASLSLLAAAMIGLIAVGRRSLDRKHQGWSNFALHPAAKGDFYACRETQS